jgi:PAS domain S-box-containing protein
MNSRNTKFLDNIFGSSDELYFIFDQHGNFIHVINTQQEILLMPPEKFIGKNYKQILPEHVCEKISHSFDMLDEGAELQKFEYALSFPGKEEWFLARIGKIRDDIEGFEGYLAQIRHITKKKETEKNLNRKEQMLEAVASANKALILNTNIIEAISEGIRDLGFAAGADRCYLFENSFDDSINKFVTSQKFEWNSGSAEPQIENPDLQGVPFSAVHDFLGPMMNRVPLNAIVNQLPEGGGLRLALEAQDIVSVLLMPIYIDDYFWGFVGFDDCRNEKLWSDSEVNLLSSLAASIASAIKRKSMEDDLRRAKEIAETANLAKTEFLANISHEIRTPLSGVVGFTSLLADTSLDGMQQEFVGNLNISSELLQHVISDILDFSKIEAGIIEISPSITNTKSFVEEVINIVKYQFAKEGNELNILISDQFPKEIYIDHVRVKQVLVNLLSNSNKFTVQGRVELSLSVENDTYKFSVSDNGIGINPEDLKKIFNPFVQLDQSRTKRKPGTGLGLSICKKILESMQSEITVESTPGQGSVFSFELNNLTVTSNMTNSNSRYTKSNVIVTGDAAFEEIRDLDILIVDDNEMNLMLASAIIKNHFPSISIHLANSGLEALDQVAQNKFSLILLDLHMPDTDGFQTLDEMKRLYRVVCPVIALTADASENARQRCLNSGMREVIIKPYTQEVMVSTIRKFVEVG